MNKNQYKQFSSRLRAAWSRGKCRSGRMTTMANKISRRMGLDGLDLDRVDIVDGACYYAGSLEFKRRGEVLARQDEKRWCGAYNAVRTMQYAADYLDGWRAVEVVEAVSI